ncbi:hypothetical protein, partial [Micromonospora sp. NPDC023633]|uniref:hypothetical protein n=1 Tax=Micromonospora sp. NPDC023633 TaxID=3154320 RepID=UPI0033DFFCB4
MFSCSQATGAVDRELRGIREERLRRADAAFGRSDLAAHLRDRLADVERAPFRCDGGACDVGGSARVASRAE